jgi:hypothetical protein
MGLRDAIRSARSRCLSRLGPRQSLLRKLTMVIEGSPSTTVRQVREPHNMFSESVPTVNLSETLVSSVEGVTRQTREKTSSREGAHEPQLVLIVLA